MSNFLILSKWFFAIFILSCSVNNLSAQDTVWINTGHWVQSLDEMGALRFNSNSIFDTSNVTLSVPANYEWSLTIINMDSINHQFNIDEFIGVNTLIPYGDTISVPIPPASYGTYRYYTSDERGKTLGTSGVLKVGLVEPIQFVWNLSDWMPSRLDSAMIGATVDVDSPYIPKYFSINSRTFPNTTNDPDGYIELNLGDTCTISIVNSGSMNHVLHFHGFHVEWVSSTDQTSRIGWIKDTVPILIGEGITLRLIANQVGVYPVHNHNLIAVTNAGFYPGGMFTMINVAP